MAEEGKKYWIQLDEQNFITSWSDNEIPNAIEVSNCDEWYSRCYVVKYENGKFSFSQDKSDELEDYFDRIEQQPSAD